MELCKVRGKSLTLQQDIVITNLSLVYNKWKKKMRQKPPSIFLWCPQFPHVFNAHYAVIQTCILNLHKD